MYVVGRVLKPHGIKGAVKVEAITSFPEHFKEMQKVYTKNEKDWQAYSVEWAKLSDRFVFLKLAEIRSIEEAGQLKDEFLYISSDELTALSDDEYYIHDLLGIAVYNESGNRIGEITDVEEYSGNDVYILKKPDGKESLIPAIKDIILNVDIAQKKMIIRVYEGLLD